MEDNGPTARKQYAQRNRLIRTHCGFDTYAAYLASDLWKSIRRSVLKADKATCRCCGRNATEVHHIRYTVKNLTGKSRKHLISICRECHEAIEFVGATKLSPTQVEITLLRRRRVMGIFRLTQEEAARLKPVKKEKPDRKRSRQMEATLVRARKIDAKEAALKAPPEMVKRSDSLGPSMPTQIPMPQRSGLVGMIRNRRSS